MSYGHRNTKDLKVSWTQAICEACYFVRYGLRRPTVIREPGREQCCDCGRPTVSGIYIREDPITVRYPRAETRSSAWKAE